jgi:hypothetical protein
MKSWLFPQRATEATADQLVATGAAGGSGLDPIDGDIGFVPAGSRGSREIPVWTLDKARAYSVAAYRTNPMARAVIDTYTAFCVGDSGLTLNCNVPEVRAIADGFWSDPKVNISAMEELSLRHHLLMGETCNEMMVGDFSGVVLYSPIDPSQVIGVDLDRGNPLWPKTLHVRNPEGSTNPLDVIAVDDLTGLRGGTAFWWPTFKTLLTDRRGFPFLGPILDQLDDYDQVISNLIDRTALMRYLTWDVTVKGDQGAVDKFIRERGGTHIPASGSVEVHNESVTWESQTANVGAAEDTQTAGTILTSIAGGAGLGKTWLAEPDGANRATSLTMAEPIRRRVGGVQNMWLAQRTELLRFVVDQAVKAGRIPAMVSVSDVTGEHMVPAAQTVTITGPEIAAADAQVTAEILVNLSAALTGMVVADLMTPEAARVAVKKGWEQFVGIPYDPALDLAGPGANDKIAEVIDDATSTVTLKLA